MSHELIIQHGDTILCPPVADGVGVEFERKGQPGKLTFECIKTDGLEFDEGNPCRFSVGGEPFFYGFVFNRSRSGDNPNKIKVTVYNQLYYLNNKDTYVYQNKTATEVIRMIAEDYGLNIGTLADTKYKIASRVEDNADMLVAVGHIIDAQVIGSGAAVMTAVQLFFVANEGISILENAARLGVPIPKKLKDILIQLKDGNDKGGGEDG